MTTGLTFRNFAVHLLECGLELIGARYTEVVIRGLDGDYHVAAVHREKQVLIIDQGHKIEEKTP